MVRHRHDEAEWQRRVERRYESERSFHAREQLGWRSSAIVGWSGMRGVVTVAAVQALPADTPYRSALILIAFTAAAATLLLGGLTLPALARALGLREPPVSTEDEIRALFEALARSGYALLDDPALVRTDGTPFNPELRERVRGDLRSQAALALRSGAFRPRAARSAEGEELRRQVLAAEREWLAEARASSEYGNAALNTAEAILNTLEAQTSEED
jgi:CPA1 family monovalent cation:H+ antiporter